MHAQSFLSILPWLDLNATIRGQWRR